jgi:hypothetical protein
MSAVRQFQQDIDNLYTTTWQYIQPKAVNNIFKATPTLKYLMQAGRVRKISGYSRLEFPVEYASTDSAVGWFGGTQDFTSQNTAAAAAEFLTTVYVDWRFIGASVYRKFVEDFKNKGKAQLLNLVEAKLNNARKTLEKVLTTDLFTLNTPSSDNKFEGIPNWVRDAPNPAYASRYTQGGIAQGEIGSGSGTYNHTWWNNQTESITGKDLALYMVPAMRTLFNDCSDGEDTPDIIIMTQALYEKYEEENAEIHQIVNNNSGDVGFGKLTFKGKSIIWESAVPAYHIYMLNTNYLYLVFDSDMYFEMTNWKEGRTDLDRVAQIVTATNLVCTNRARQGVIPDAGN